MSCFFFVLSTGMSIIYVRIPQRRNTEGLNSATRCSRCVCTFMTDFMASRSYFFYIVASFDWFQEKVRCVEGTREFLEALGFISVMLPVDGQGKWTQKPPDKFLIDRPLGLCPLSYHRWTWPGWLCIFIFYLPFLGIRGGRGVPGVTRAESRWPGVDEGEEGSPPERRASQSSAGQAASSFQTLSQRPAFRAAAGVLQPIGGGAQEGATAEVQLHC